MTLLLCSCTPSSWRAPRDPCCGLTPLCRRTRAQARAQCPELPSIKVPDVAVVGGALSQAVFDATVLDVVRMGKIKVGSNPTQLQPVGHLPGLGDRDVRQSAALFGLRAGSGHMLPAGASATLRVRRCMRAHGLWPAEQQ